MSLLSKIKSNKMSFVREAFIGLLIVMTISVISKSIVGVVDSYCVSYFIKDEGLAAVSLFKPLEKIIATISSIFAVGSTLLITKLFSKGEKKKGNLFFSSVLIFIIGLSCTLFIILFFLSKPIAISLSLNKTSEQVVKLTSSYMKGFAIGIPFTFINEHLFQLVYLDNDKKRPAISVVSIFITNILFDILLGKYLTDKAFGIGLASSLAYLISTLILFTHFLSKKSSIKFSLNGFRFSIIADSIKSGFPVGIKKGATTLRNYLMNIIMLTIGTMGFGVSGDLIIAAYHINDSIQDIFTGIVEGIVPTIIMLGNVFYSEEDNKSLNELLKEVVKTTFIVGGILTVIYFTIPTFIAPWWSDNPIVVDQSIMAMRMSAASLILTMITSSSIAFFQGFKKNTYAVISSVLKSLVIPIIITCIFAFTIGPYGIWIAQPTYYTTYLLIHFIYVFVKNKKIRFDIVTLFFLDKNFGFSEDETYEIKINSIIDTYQMQQKVSEFLDKFELSKDRKNKLAYCSEELGTLIVLSGFSRFKKRGKKRPYASMKIFYKKDKDLLIIRTRDNCEKFDIKEKIKEIKNGENIDPALNCSIKLILSMSKDIEYFQILKTNNMVIKV